MRQIGDLVRQIENGTLKGSMANTSSTEQKARSGKQETGDKRQAAEETVASRGENLEIASVGRRDSHTGTDLVLPLELRPHGSESLIGAGGGAYVVHDIELNVIQIDISLLSCGAVLVDNCAEDVACLCRRHLERRDIMAADKEKRGMRKVGREGSRGDFYLPLRRQVLSSCLVGQP